MRVLSRSKKAAAPPPGGGASSAGAGEVRAGRRRAGGVPLPASLPLSPIHLYEDGVPLAAARADRRAADPAAAPAQLEDERAQNPRARGSDRVPERHRAAVDVDAALVNPEHADRVQGDRG